MRTLVALAAVAAASAFAPGAMTGLRLKSAAAVSRRPATSPKMSLDAIEGAQQLLAVAQNVPFVDEVTGEAQGFTAPLNHFASVSALEIIPGVAGATCRLSLSTAYPLPACNPQHTRRMPACGDVHSRAVPGQHGRMEMTDGDVGGDRIKRSCKALRQRRLVRAIYKHGWSNWAAQDRPVDSFARRRGRQQLQSHPWRRGEE